MKIVIIDNYDSFTYNLAHLVKELGAEVTVLRNDKFRMEDLQQFDKRLSFRQALVFLRRLAICWTSSRLMPGKTHVGRLSRSPGHRAGIQEAN